MRNKLKILIAEPEGFSKKAISSLLSVAQVSCKYLRQPGVRKALEKYDAVWIRLGLRVEKKDIPVCPKCRWIITATTGIDHLDVKAMKEAGIEVVSLRGHEQFLETISSTAELTMGLILSVIRKIPQAFCSVSRGEWNRDKFRGFELKGKTLGIVGFGRLGRFVAGYCKSFGMNVLVYDPYCPERTAGVKRVNDLRILLKTSDIVSIHAKLTEETRGMADKAWFDGMKRGSYLINTSRGDIVDEKALINALKSGRLAGAAVDVVSGEPCVTRSHKLVRYACSNDNLIITPHIGGASIDAMSKCEEYLAEYMKRRTRAD